VNASMQVASGDADESVVTKKEGAVTGDDVPADGGPISPPAVRNREEREDWRDNPWNDYGTPDRRSDLEKTNRTIRHSAGGRL
jgi:hypothetical protein